MNRGKVDMKKNLIFIEDEVAPDARQEFEKEFFKIIGIELGDWKQSAERLETDAEIIAYRKGDYQIELYADAQYWHLYKIYNENEWFIFLLTNKYEVHFLPFRKEKKISVKISDWFSLSPEPFIFLDVSEKELSGITLSMINDIWKEHHNENLRGYVSNN